MAKGVAHAPFDPSQKWNVVINVAVGGQFPRKLGEEG
eukprot:gene43311-39540_t